MPTMPQYLERLLDLSNYNIKQTNSTSYTYREHVVSIFSSEVKTPMGSLHPDILIYERKQSFPLINDYLKSLLEQSQLVGINHVWVYSLFFINIAHITLHLAIAISLNIWCWSAVCFIHRHSEMRDTACVPTAPWNMHRADVPVQTQNVWNYFQDLSQGCLNMDPLREMGEGKNTLVKKTKKINDIVFFRDTFAFSREKFWLEKSTSGQNTIEQNCANTRLKALSNIIIYHITAVIHSKFFKIVQKWKMNSIPLWLYKSE